MQLELRQDESGPRHYLGDKPVHCGTVLEFRRGQHWYEGRYECSGPISDFGAYIIGGGDSTCFGLDDIAELRWPAR